MDDRRPFIKIPIPAPLSSRQTGDAYLQRDASSTWRLSFIFCFRRLDGLAVAGRVRALYGDAPDAPDAGCASGDVDVSGAPGYLNTLKYLRTTFFSTSTPAAPQTFIFLSSRS